jgi:hypothetical protein
MKGMKRPMINDAAITPADGPVTTNDASKIDPKFSAAKAREMITTPYTTPVGKKLLEFTIQW